MYEIYFQFNISVESRAMFVRSLNLKRILNANVLVLRIKQIHLATPFNCEIEYTKNNW